jgi:hypothetical protein
LQFVANIVATSQGTPDAAAAPPSPDATGPAPELPDDGLPEELPPPEEAPEDVDVGEAPGAAPGT